MDLSDGAGALASAEQWVLGAALCGPAEAALPLRVLAAHVRERRWHVNELLELLLVGVGVSAISRVTLLLFHLAIDVHRLLRVANFFHRELHSSDFKNIALLNLIVLPTNTNLKLAS